MDLIISKEPDLVEEIEVLGQFASSDHSLIKFQIVVSEMKTISKKRSFDYTRACMNAVREEVGKIPWKLQAGAIELWDDLRTNILEIKERMIQQKILRGKKKQSIWMNQRTVKAVNKKHRIYSKYKQGDHPACVRANKEAKEAVEEARRNFENMLAKNIKSDVKSFYAYARSKSKTRVSVGPLKDETGVVIDTDEEMCEAFNEYFASVFTVEDTTTIPTPVVQIWKQSCENALSEIKIDLGVVESRLDKLMDDKSTGADELSPRLLEQIQGEIKMPIVRIWKK